MEQDLQWLISVDDHIIEPPNVWVDRASAADRDRVPHVERIDGVDTWVYEKHRATVMGILVAAHQQPETTLRCRSTTTNCRRSTTTRRLESPTWTRITSSRG